MKKIGILMLLLFLFTLGGCSCSNQFETRADGFDVKIAKELEPYLLYPESMPILHFDMKDVNISTTSTQASYVLVNNDFYKVSEAWGKHLSQYNSHEQVIILEVEQKNDKGKAKFGGETLKLDEVDEIGKPQMYSKEIRMVAWTKNGTRYSYQYRTFVSGGKRYYAYCYSVALSMTLEQSLMVERVNGENKLLFVPLPYDTKYEVSGSTLTVDALINKMTYLDEKYHKYAYPSSLSLLPLEEQKEKVRNWYETYCNGQIIEDTFVIEYAGAKYQVEFDKTKIDVSTSKEVPAFELTYIGKA